MNYCNDIDPDLAQRKEGKCWMPNLNDLKEKKIEFTIIKQQPGDIIIGKPGVYHAVWSQVIKA